VPKFVYKAKDGPSETVEGELLAENEAAALEKIEQRGLSPVWVKERHAAGSEETGLGLRFRRIRGRDVTVFTRQLAGMTRSGVPILRALKTIEEQSRNPRFQRVVAELEASVRDGRMLSEALSAHPGVFPELYINMVRAGESAGMLDTILFRVADAREKEEQVIRKVQAALAYPVLVLTLGVLTVVAMLTIFIPRISTLLRQASQELPTATKILLAISDIGGKYGFWIIIAIVAVVLLLRQGASRGHGKTVADRLKLRMPVFGPLIKEAGIARFARSMSLLITSGIPVERGLKLSSAVLTNSVMRREIEEVRDKTVTRGMSVAAGLKGSKCFPVFVRNMIAVGEESGQLNDSLADIAAYYEGEVERRMAIMTSLIEPVLILVVGGIVGFIAFAMLLPIFTITQAIS
jgi:type IV pilus assembly protein PilC